MAIRGYKPTSPSRRNMTSLTNEEITKSTPEKSLLVSLSKTGGRNSSGQITCRHIGGGHKRKYRVIDFKRNKDNVPGKVAAIEYDPNRTANIALIHYADGEKRYILAPKGLEVGKTVVSGERTDVVVGNAMPLANIPEGTMVHNVELKAGKGGQKFDKSAIQKIKYVRKLNQEVLIEVDGGINDETGAKCVKAGADILVSGSYIYNNDAYEAIQSLKGKN